MRRHTILMHCRLNSQHADDTTEAQMCVVHISPCGWNLEMRTCGCIYSMYGLSDAVKGSYRQFRSSTMIGCGIKPRVIFARKIRVKHCKTYNSSCTELMQQDTGGADHAESRDMASLDDSLDSCHYNRLQALMLQVRSTRLSASMHRLHAAQPINLIRAGF